MSGTALTDLLKIAQRTPEWYAARLGRLTGSVASDMLATIKSGEAAARRDLRARLVTERLTGVPQDDGYINAAMQRGIECEPIAFASYEAVTGRVARQVGFIQHPTEWAGCSPDGIVDDDGLLEIKCPKSATHLRYLRDGKVPTEHLPQITHNLWVSGRAWCDFVSFDDRFPEPMQVFVARVRREDVDLETYAKKAVAFLAEVEAEVAACRTLWHL